MAKTTTKKRKAKRANGAKVTTPAALAKGHGSKKFRDALTALGARRKSGPIRTDVLLAGIAAGMSEDELLDTWRLVYPTATPHQVRCYLKGGVFADSVAKKLAAIANGKPKAKKGGAKK